MILQFSLNIWLIGNGIKHSKGVIFITIKKKGVHNSLRGGEKFQFQMIKTTIR